VRAGAVPGRGDGLAVTDAAALAQRALAAVGEAEALVTVTRERSLLRRFARSTPTQATAVDDSTVEVAVVQRGHVGHARTNRVDAAGLAECASAARLAASSAAAAGPGGFPGFPPPALPRLHHGHDPATAALDPAPGAEALGRIFEAAAARGVQASGIWTGAEVETAIASTQGVAAEDRVTDALVRVVAFAPGGRSGFASQTASAESALDPVAVAALAAEKAAARGRPAGLEPGEYTVVMEPHATRELLWVLAETAFDGQAHTEGRGALAGRLGEQVVSPRVNLSDSPRYPGTLPRAFDAEGVPKAPLPLIQDGVAHRVAHHLRSAAEAGTASTGHALEAGDTEGPRTTNLVMVGGGAADERELCRGVERGIYVTRLWYTNVLRERESLFTAVTRDGTFLIEDGQVTRPLTDMRVTDSALEILARTRDLGARPVLTSEGEFYGRRFAHGTVCPPLLADGVRFTGSAVGAG
jgi:PmbA protein